MRVKRVKREKKEKIKKMEQRETSNRKKSVLHGRDIIAIDINSLDSEIRFKIHKLQERGEAGPWIKKAIDMKHKAEQYPKAFLIDILNTNYELARHLLRKIGNGRKICSQ